MKKIAGVVKGVLGLGFVLVLVGGCEAPTSFQGGSKFPGGAEACFHRCREQRMEMASFVYVGEFSTACACRLQTVAMPTPAAGAPNAAAGDDAGAVVAAATGVEMQRRRLEEERRRNTTMPTRPMLFH